MLDGGQMCERITSREFDRTSDTVQPLLKLFRGVGLGRAPYHSGGSYHSLSPSSTSRMLKKPTSFVLASFRPSTYPRGYAYGPSLAAALLDELFEHPAWPHPVVLHVPTYFLRSLLALSIF